MKSTIVAHYMHWVNEHESEPKSVFKFCQDATFSESEFYESFSDLSAVKEDVLAHLWEDTLRPLSEQDFYLEATPNEKLLSAMYGFVETLKSNRSYLVQAFKGWNNPGDTVRGLGNWRKAFVSYLSTIGIEGVQTGFDMLDAKSDVLNHHALFSNAVFVFHYWLNDRSKGFEKTDACIEKSFTLSLELMQSHSLKKAIDLGKFLFQSR